MENCGGEDKSLIEFLNSLEIARNLEFIKTKVSHRISALSTDVHEGAQWDRRKQGDRPAG